jgi:hypothetical protein
MLVLSPAFYVGCLLLLVVLYIMSVINRGPPSSA